MVKIYPANPATCDHADPVLFSLFFFLFFLFFLGALHAETLSEFEYKRKIYDHLLIRDAKGAVGVAKEALEAHPASQEIQAAHIQALCALSDASSAWSEWKKRPHLSENRELLEQLAWAMLKEARESAQREVHFNALIGAVLTRDAKAVPLLIRELNSSNALFRSIAIALAVQLGDDQLKTHIARLLREEKTWYVRVQAMRAVGTLGMQELYPELKEIVANPKTLAEEKHAAMTALVMMMDGVEERELLSLASSNRAGLRELAVQIAIHFDQMAVLPKLFFLLKDPSAHVRISMLNAIALLRVHSIEDRSVLSTLEQMLSDSSPEVGLTAAYALLLLDRDRGEHAFAHWLNSDSARLRRLAAAALSISGGRGTNLSYKVLNNTEDLFVKANLALGLIRERQHVSEAAEVLADIMMQQAPTALWMWETGLNPLFSALSPSSISHSEDIPNAPELEDQFVHLELLNALSIVHYPNVREVVKMLLKTRFKSVDMAAFELLQTGDDAAVETIRSLLEESDPELRFQAAIILALYGKEPSALSVLQETYPHVGRWKKMEILEAIAQIGDVSSIPFLVTVLDEPYQVLRLKAASALLRCLYN